MCNLKFKASTAIRYLTLAVMGGFTAHLGYTVLTWPYWALTVLTLVYGLACTEEAKR
jgi:uncharacterized membrane protein HdeD (DUF308 family)